MLKGVKCIFQSSFCFHFKLEMNELVPIEHSFIQTRLGKIVCT